MRLRMLDGDGIAVVQDYLKVGNSLCRRLVQHFDFSTGTLWTFLPESVPEEEANDLVSGSVALSIVDIGKRGAPIVGQLIPLGNPPTFAWIADYLQQVGSYVICEDRIARPNDPLVVGEPYCTHVFYGEEVYVYIPRAVLDDEQVGAALALASDTTGGVSVLARISDGGPPFAQRAHLSSAQLDSIVRGVEHIVFEAYDGEGYVIWSQRCPTP